MYHTFIFSTKTQQPMFKSIFNFFPSKHMEDDLFIYFLSKNMGRKKIKYFSSSFKRLKEVFLTYDRDIST